MKKNKKENGHISSFRLEILLYTLFYLGCFSSFPAMTTCVYFCALVVVYDILIHLDEVEDPDWLMHGMLVVHVSSILYSVVLKSPQMSLTAMFVSHFFLHQVSEESDFAPLSGVLGPLSIAAPAVSPLHIATLCMSAAK